jgi:hypothetical protein
MADRNECSGDRPIPRRRLEFARGAANFTHNERDRPDCEAF